MEKFNIDPYFINGQHRITINIVGAGGTGSLLVTKLARLSQALNHLDHLGLFIKLIDFDKIEPHNVGRQMFTLNDVGHYKSDVLISKINHAFGLDWEMTVEPYNSDIDDKCNITIAAVDNVVTRQLMLKAFYRKHGSYTPDIKKKYLFIDCGNARDYGQIILSDFNKKLKNIDSIIPNWDKQDTIEQQGQGCSYAESLLEQDLFINDWVSLYAITIIKDLLFKKQIDYQGFFFNTSDYLTQKIMI